MRMNRLASRSRDVNFRQMRHDPKSAARMTTAMIPIETSTALMLKMGIQAPREICATTAQRGANWRVVHCSESSWRFAKGIGGSCDEGQRFSEKQNRRT